MDTSYDKVISYLTEEQGLSLEEAEEIMVLCVEQGMNPTEIFGRGLIDMLNLLPKKKKVEAPKPTVAPKSVSSTSTGTPVQGKLLTKTGKAQNFTGGRTPFTGTDPMPGPSLKPQQPKATPVQTTGQLKINFNPAAKPKVVSGPSPTKVQPPAPKPEFGPNAVKSTPYKTSKPELRPGGQTPKPEFKTTQPRPNAGGATVIPRTNANTRVVQPQAPKPNFGQSLQNLGNRAYATAAAKTPTRLPRGSRLKGPLAVAAEIGAEMALEPVAKAGGNALTRTILDIMGKGNRARQVAPSLYGKAGPDFTPDIAKGIQQRSKLAQQSAETQAASQPKPQPTGERSAAANAEKQELAKAEAQRRREAAAPKPAPKPPTAQERAYGARSKLTAAQQELNRQYDIDRGLKDGRVTKPNSPALDKYLAKRKK